MREGLWGFGLALAAAAAFALPAAAEGRLEWLAAFHSGGEDFRVGTYTVENGGKLGILWFQEGDTHTELGFDLKQWLVFQRLVEAANASQADDWRAIGDLTEVGVDDPLHITVFGRNSRGSAIRFVIDSARGDHFVYDLASGDRLDLPTAISRVRLDLFGCQRQADGAPLECIRK